MSTSGASGASLPETEVVIQRVAGMIASARALPLSSSVKLDSKDEILELLREAAERLPEELRQARWMLKEREEFLAATQRKADELVEAARSEAQRLVQRTEILKEAQAQARRALEQAREEAQKLKLEAEDYADQRLAQFEIVLERTLKTVAAGRQKLAGAPGAPATPEAAGPAGMPQGSTPPGPTGSLLGGARVERRPHFEEPRTSPGMPGATLPRAAAPGALTRQAAANGVGHQGQESVFDQDSLD